MLNVMILEDCLESRRALSAIVAEINESVHVFPASSFREAQDILLSEKTIDLFLLDINLVPDEPKEQSGLVFSKKIREDGRYLFTPIIFVTSIAELEMASYREAQCYRYITKPYSKEEIKKTVEKVLYYKEGLKEKQITIKKGGINYRIKLNEIVYIKAVPRGIHLVLKNETVEVKYMSIKQILAQVKSSSLIQCHRMFVINMNYIEYVDLVNRMIKMNGCGEVIEIGVTYKNELRERLHE